MMYIQICLLNSLLSIFTKLTMKSIKEYQSPGLRQRLRNRGTVKRNCKLILYGRYFDPMTHWQKPKNTHKRSSVPREYKVRTFRQELGEFKLVRGSKRKKSLILTKPMHYEIKSQIWVLMCHSHPTQVLDLRKIGLAVYVRKQLAQTRWKTTMQVYFN